MPLYIDEDAISEMIGDENSPINEQMQRLRSWLANALRTTNERGEPDAAVIYKQGAYNMGEYAIHIGMLTLKNKLKLASLKKELKKKRGEVYARMAMTKQKWMPSKEGETILIESDPDLCDAVEKVECQEEFVAFLQDMQDKIRYYPRNADALVRVHNLGQEIGQIIVGLKR